MDDIKEPIESQDSRSISKALKDASSAERPARPSFSQNDPDDQDPVSDQLARSTSSKYSQDSKGNTNVEGQGNEETTEESHEPDTTAQSNNRRYFNHSQVYQQGWRFPPHQPATPPESERHSYFASPQTVTPSEYQRPRSFPSSRNSNQIVDRMWDGGSLRLPRYGRTAKRITSDPRPASQNSYQDQPQLPSGEGEGSERLASGTYADSSTHGTEQQQPRRVAPMSYSRQAPVPESPTPTPSPSPAPSPPPSPAPSPPSSPECSPQPRSQPNGCPSNVQPALCQPAHPDHQQPSGESPASLSSEQILNGLGEASSSRAPNPLPRTGNRRARSYEYFFLRPTPERRVVINRPDAIRRAQIPTICITPPSPSTNPAQNLVRPPAVTTEATGNGHVVAPRPAARHPTGSSDPAQSDTLGRGLDQALYRYRSQDSLRNTNMTPRSRALQPSGSRIRVQNPRVAVSPDRRMSTRIRSEVSDQTDASGATQVDPTNETETLVGSPAAPAVKRAPGAPGDSGGGGVAGGAATSGDGKSKAAWCSDLYWYICESGWGDCCELCCWPCEACFKGLGNVIKGRPFMDGIRKPRNG